MNIAIKSADIKHIDECVNILQNSEVGEAYFSSYEKARDLLSSGIVQKGLFVALSDNEECLGFIYHMQKGVFGSYPYLHIIAVKEEYRCLGIGKQLMNYFEENSSHYASTKCFLTVDDFNLRAKNLYERIGYQCVGELPDFYKKGINCYLMMKVVKKVGTFRLDGCEVTE